MKHKLLHLLLLAAVWTGAQGQQAASIRLDGSVNGTTIGIPCTGMTICDDGGAGAPYERGHDCRVVLAGNCASVPAGSVPHIAIASLDIADQDTLYFYDGDNIQAPLLLKLNSHYRSDSTDMVRPSNAEGKVMVRFKAKGGSAPTGDGFVLNGVVRYPCEPIVALIDNEYTLGGAAREFGPLALDDTLALPRAATFCGPGERVRMTGTGYYAGAEDHPFETADNVRYCWTFSDGYADTTTAPEISYTIASGGIGQLWLTIMDEHGCLSEEADSVQLMVAGSPIRGIASPLPDLHGYETMLLTAGADSTHTLRLDTRVGIDSVAWAPDTNYETDFPGGGYGVALYHGLVVENHGGMESTVGATNLTQHYQLRAYVYDQFGCVWDTTTAISTLADSTLGIAANATEATARLYPNPATESATLTLAQAAERETRVTIANAAGQQVQTLILAAGATTATIDTRALPGGTYYVQIAQAGMGETIKLIVLKGK